MAARTSTPSLAQQERARAAIQTTQLVNRLQAYALGQPAPNARKGDDTPLEIDANRLRAIEILLRKALPDLSAVAIEGGDPEKPVRIAAAPLSAEQWIAAHGARGAADPA